MDSLITAPKQDANRIEEKFFNSHRSADPVENALVNFIKRKNDSLHFIAKTVKQIGYPRWDKAFVQTKKSISASYLSGSSGDSTNIYYIPFVRDSQNFVNASMIITTTQSDTSFMYKCDWQYSQMTNNTNEISDSAEYFAIFFMALDHTVFGYNEFKIIDTNLFRQQDHQPLKVKFNNLLPGQNNMYELITTCQNVNIYINDCPEIAGQCQGPGGSCDYCYAHCTSSIIYNYCWTEYVNTGGGGESGGTPTGGNGDTGNGGTPPDPCNGTPDNPAPFAKGNTSNVVNPGNCPPPGTGWIPIEDPDDPAPPVPCDPFIQSLNQNSNFIYYLKYLNSTPVKTQPYEAGYAVTFPNTYQFKVGNYNVPQIEWSNLNNISAIMHCHYTGLAGIFSPNDIILMAQIYIGNYANDNANLFFALTTPTGNPIIMKVKDQQAFRAFALSIVGDGVGGWDQLKMNQFRNEYTDKLRSPNQETNMVAFLNMLKEMNAENAMGLYQSDKNCVNWNPATLSPLGSLTIAPCQ